MRRLFPAALVGIGLYVACSLAMDLGPLVEARLFPVRVDQVVDRVAREGDRLCWDWSGRKVRRLASDNLDVFVHVNGGEGLVSTVADAVTGMPWRASAAPGLGPVRKRYCLTLPPGVRPSDDVGVAWAAWYPSGTGLWRLYIPLPEFVSPGIRP